MATRLDQKDFVKTALRLPPELHAAVHEAAAKSGRSYNAELVALLEKGLSAPDAFILAPAAVGHVNEAGDYVVSNPKELFNEMHQHLQRAYVVAELFKRYEDGEPRPVDISNPPDWPDLPIEEPPSAKPARKPKP